MHGWCAEKENRGKGGSGKGKIGVGVRSCRSMDPVGISSGSRRDPVGHQFAFLGTAFGQSGSSRDPVGRQCREAAKDKKNTFLQCFCAFFGDFGYFPTGPNVVIGARLDPDGGAQMQKLVPDWVPTGSRLGPDWIPTGFLQKNTYFPKFEHLFLKF